MGHASRVTKFSFVGAIGIGVQLAVLTALLHWRIPYLWATGFAVEAAVLHNFVWHERFTWADRASPSRFDRLLRFHLSNGLISLVGNLLAMRVLVGWLAIPAIPANLLSITTCWAANYLASDRWVFLAYPERLTLPLGRNAPASKPVCVGRTEHKGALP